MKYNLPHLDRSEFDSYHTFVQACFSRSRRRSRPQLAILSNDWQQFPEFFSEHLRDRTSLGTTMHDAGERHSVFHLWLNPSWNQPTQSFYTTLTHELVHGYAGLDYGHGYQWRHWFSRVMWHLNESRMLPQYDNNLYMRCFNIDLTYNEGSATTSMDTVVKAFKMAEAEHDLVKTNYLERLCLA